MNKNKKITLLTMVALTTLCATGCGMKPEDIKEEVNAFIESHNKIGAAMLMDAGVLGAQKSLKENNLDVNVDKYFVYDKVVEEEMGNINKLKSKELKKLSGEANEFYDKNKELLEKVKKDDINLEQYSSEVEKLESEVIENLQKSKYLKSYEKLRKKAGLEVLTEYDQSEGWLEEFKNEYEDDLKNLMGDVVSGTIVSAVKDELVTDIPDLDFAKDNESLDFIDEEMDVEIKEEKTSKNESSENNVVGSFLKKLVRNSGDEEELSVNEEDGSIAYNSKNGGQISVYVASEDSKLDYLSVDAMLDISDISGEVKTVVSKFCDEVSLDKKSVLEAIDKLYSEVSSDKYLNSEEAKSDIKNYDLVEKEVEIGNNAYVEMTIHNPQKSKTEMVGLTIGIRE